MAIDPFLYLSLGVGFLAGRLSRYHGPWVGRTTVLTIGLLVFLLGTTLGFAPVGALLAAVPLGIVFVVLILGITIAVDRVVSRRLGTFSNHRSPPAKDGRSPYRLPLALLASVLAGIAVGHAWTLATGTYLTYTLYLLLALIGYDLNVIFPSPRTVVAPVCSAVIGAAGAAVVVTLLFGLPGRVAFATAFGFGWYTLTGPLVVRAAGPALGLIAFVTNFLREDLTMLSAPWAGPRVGGEGLVAMGGAASMDTTLYFVTRYGDPKAGAVSLSSGLLLTVLASLLVPLFLGIPG
ncbi:MAG TPA: LysO family transporter [Thermoplasmata archaeon]|nr:LysO family transporter [Thermoplasmata archaeon]